MKKISLSSSNNLFMGDIVYLYITRDHRIVTLDRANRTPLMFDSTGNFLTKIGDYGEGPGEFKGVSAICYDELNKMWYVSDNALLRVSVFKDSGEYIRKFKMTSPVRVMRISQNGHLYLFMPNRRNRPMIERLNLEGERNASFLTSKMVQKLRFGISGGVLCLTPEGIFATHYLSSDLSYFDHDGNQKTKVDLEVLTGFVPPKDPTGNEDPALYITSFTGISGLMNGPYGTTLIQYGRAVFRRSAAANQERPDQYLAFLTDNCEVISSGITLLAPFKASDSHGNLYSIEYPAPNSENNVENPYIVQWTLRDF